MLIINQKHRNLDVEAGQFAIHCDEQGNVKMIHGKLVKNLPPPNIRISESVALKNVLSIIGSTKYAWEDPQWEQQIKNDLQKQNATYFPKEQLMYARIKTNNDFSAANYRLVYRFEIKSLMPQNLHEEVLCDAETGEIIRKQSLMHNAWGTVNTLYNGTTNFNTKWRGFPNYDYILKDHDRGDKLHTLKYSTWGWGWRPEVTDQDNVWSEPAATSHWAVQVSWDYFANTFGRNGLDNAGGKIRIEAEGPDVNAAFYRAGGYDYLYFGRTFTGVEGSLTPIDIVGHEFTHGITSHTAGLPYSGESGALDESFSDIFGVMVERDLEGVTSVATN